MKCRICGEKEAIGRAIPVCAECAKKDDVKVLAEEIHRRVRSEFSMPLSPPRKEDGIRCTVCANECSMGEGDTGYCTVRRVEEGRIKYLPGERAAFCSWYHDGLPTNCVADWICPGGVGAGFPRFANKPGPEYGYNNLAVFYHACSFDCLFCQNWHYRTASRTPRSAEELAEALDSRTSCICYFGGDPTPQIEHALLASRIALERRKGSILRICWETNGSMARHFLDEMISLSLESGGIIKFDLKAYNENLHILLTGVSNERTFENFAYAASFVNEREDVPLLTASTLLIPHLIDEEEVFNIARFIASLNPAIPYRLLAFHPDFYMPDLPPTSRRLALACLEAARSAGLERVSVGNIHVLS